MADEDEVAPTKAQLANLGGTPEDYQVPEDIMEQVDQATYVAPAEETEKESEKKETLRWLTNQMLYLCWPITSAGVT
jgi:hypothetical protein